MYIYIYTGFPQEVIDDARRIRIVLAANKSAVSRYYTRTQMFVPNVSKFTDPFCRLLSLGSLAYINEALHQAHARRHFLATLQIHPKSTPC